MRPVRPRNLRIEPVAPVAVAPYRVEPAGPFVEPIDWVTDYSDLFPGAALDGSWTVDDAGGTGAVSVSGGFARIDPNASTGLVAAPNRIPGPRFYRSVTGDFDIRMRTVVNDDADSAEAPATAVRTSSLYASEAAATAVNWIEAVSGVNNSAPNTRVGSNQASSGGALTLHTGSASTTAQDLRLVRIAQSFYALFRATGSAALSSNDGWILDNVYNRTTDPMPSALLVGPMCRSNSGTNTLVKIDEFILRTPR